MEPISGMWLYVVYAIILVLALRFMGVIKIPVKKNTAGILALLIFVGLAWNQGWLAGLALPGQPSAPAPQFQFEVTGSESDPNLVYNQADRVFTVNVTENTTSGLCSPDNVTFTLTIRRVDTLAENNAIAVITTSIPKWKNERNPSDTNEYSAVVKDTDGLYKVVYTPVGGDSTKERASILMPPASSKTVTVVVHLTDDIDTLNLYNSKDIVINAAGTVFRVRVLLNAQVS